MASSGSDNPLLPASIVTWPSLCQKLPTPENASLLASIHTSVQCSSLYDLHAFSDSIATGRCRSSGAMNELHEYQSQDHTRILLPREHSERNLGRRYTNCGALTDLAMSDELTTMRTRAEHEHQDTKSSQLKEESLNFPTLTGPDYNIYDQVLDGDDFSTSLSANTRSYFSESRPLSPSLRSPQSNELGQIIPSIESPQIFRLLSLFPSPNYGNQYLGEDSQLSSFQKEDEYSFWSLELAAQPPVIHGERFTMGGSMEVAREDLCNSQDTSFRHHDNERYPQYVDQREISCVLPQRIHGEMEEIDMELASETLHLRSSFHPTASVTSNSVGIANHPQTSLSVPVTPPQLADPSYGYFSLPNSIIQRSASAYCPPFSDRFQQSQSASTKLETNETVASRVEEELVARSESKMNFILQCRESGMSYKSIKALGKFPEAESTLRGMVRNATKEKEARPRKPVWTSRDIAILKETVSGFLSNSPGYHSLQSAEHTSVFPKFGERALQRVPWKQIAESMAKRGCHLYGNATVKKKYLEVMGYSSGKKEQKKGRKAVQTLTAAED